MTDTTLRDEIALALADSYDHCDEVDRLDWAAADAVLAIPRIAAALRQAAAIENAHLGLCRVTLFPNDELDAGTIHADSLLRQLRAVGDDTPPPACTCNGPDGLGVHNVYCDLFDEQAALVIWAGDDTPEAPK